MFRDCKSTLNIPAFLKKLSENNNLGIVPRSETQKNIDKKKLNIYKEFNAEPSTDNCYSKNYLNCPECNGIPKIITITNEDILFICDFCGFSEKVKMKEIIDIKSNSSWLKKVYYKCNVHKGPIKPYASKYCKTCDLFLCEKCLKEHNKEDHIDFIPDLDDIFCEKHSSKIIKFCNSCKDYFCDTCIKIGHKSHEIKEQDENDKLNMNTLQKYYKKLEEGKMSKIHVLEKLEVNAGDNISNKKYELLNSFKKELNEVESLKAIGRIIYFSSKKILNKNYKEEIINNYLEILYYICSLFNEENINEFNQLIQTKIKECQIIENNLSDKEKEILKENIKNTFSPIDSSISDFNKKKIFIENNIDFSRILEKHIIIEKNKNPDNFINIDETLNNFDKVMDGIKTKSPDFILSLISKYASKNGTEVFISKTTSEEFKNIELSSIQSLFSLGTQKKYELHFDLGEKENESVLNSFEKQETFLQVYKKIIAKELNIKEDSFIFKDIHRGSLGASLAFVVPSDESQVSLEKLEGKINIKKIEEKPLLEVLQISSNILDPQGNRFNGWGINEKRGEEDYIPPTENWEGYGLKVLGMYDNGNNDWLGYENKKGEFAIAYMGINNFLGDSNKMVSDINDFGSNIKKKPTSKLFRKDSNKRNSGIFSFLFNYRKCGDGICLFQDPKIAENYAGIINVNGFQIKVILMCRVNPKKIRQPENFDGCWILNPTPDEIRPYRILIKKIPNSPLTDGNFLTVAMKPIDYIIKLFSSKDYSFYENRIKYLTVLENNDTNLNKKDSKNFWERAQKFPNDKFALTFYSAQGFYWIINGYLRDETFFEKKEDKLKMPIEHVKSFIFCMQESLKKNRNVKDGIVVYRGINTYKFPQDIGKGSQFYYREFISTSIYEKTAREFIYSEKGSLLIITIKNNNERNYCFGIKNFSVFPKEGEIIISSFCRFIVTEIKRDEEGIDIVKLDCEGFKLDELLKDEK